METQELQTFANHVRFHPLFHFFILPVMMLNALFAIILLIREPHVASAWILILSIALLMAVLQIRFYALRVQDRVIRLEERLRLASILPEPLRARIPELSMSQLIGLRFASDDELPSLVERALAQKLGAMEIKKAVVNWRADQCRI